MTQTTEREAVSEPRETAGPERVNRPVWQLVLGAAAVIAILWALGGWALPLVVVLIILMVLLHEFGHFITAKLTGMKASEFFVGFGPRLWSKKVGETEYGIKAGVIGGYVKIIGMSSLEKVSLADESRTFRSKSFPRRVLVASAGSLMHLLIAFCLALAVVASVGEVTDHTVHVYGFVGFKGVTENPAQLSGLKSGDQIIAVDGHAVHNEAYLTSVIRHSIGRPVRLEVLRHGRDVVLTATPVNAQHVEEATGSGGYARAASTRAGIIGVYLTTAPVYTQVPGLSTIPAAAGFLWRFTDLEVRAVAHIFSPSGIGGLAHQVINPSAANNPKYYDDRPVSIVGIGRLAVDAARTNLTEFLGLFMVFNIGIGLINMLPMLPLDGGYVAIAIYERIRTRRGRAPYRADVNKLTPVVYAFLAVLLVIFLSSLYLDITHPLHL